MSDEQKNILGNNNNNNDTLNDKRFDYGAVTFTSKTLSTSSAVDHGQERLNQLGYKQVNFSYLRTWLLVTFTNQYVCRNYKEDCQPSPHLVSVNSLDFFKIHEFKHKLKFFITRPCIF